MTYKNSLKICRLLVAVLLFNIVVPMAMADSSNANTILICSTAGLVEVNVSDLSNSVEELETQKSQLSNEQNAQHCPFCNLNDVEFKLNNLNLSYPSPDNRVISHYQSVARLAPAKTFAKNSPLRAPPAYH